MLCVIAYNKVTYKVKRSGFLTKDVSIEKCHSWNIIPASSKINMSPNETMTYENIADINSCVNVNDLKGYIGRKQINEGLKEESLPSENKYNHPLNVIIQV
jgi:hypothetical protein